MTARPATLVPSVALGLMSFVGYQDVINRNVDYELRALAKDVREENDLASEKPKLTQKATALLNKAHVNDARWQVRPANEDQ